MDKILILGRILGWKKFGFCIFAKVLAKAGNCGVITSVLSTMFEGGAVCWWQSNALKRLTPSYSAASLAKSGPIDSDFPHFSLTMRPTSTFSKA